MLSNKTINFSHIIIQHTQYSSDTAFRKNNLDSLSEEAIESKYTLYREGSGEETK